MIKDDLALDQISKCLDRVKVDLIVCGSVGSVECFFVIRWLRRLGANVCVTLSPSGDMFVTQSAFSWASGSKVSKDYDPSNGNHLGGDGDICVVAAASASFIGKIVSGISDSVASCLVQSYLGYGDKPVMVIPSMHNSLFYSPIVSKNIDKLSAFKQVFLIESKVEHGKHKFPDPKICADKIAHCYHKFHRKKKSSNSSNNLVLAMGGTRGYIDDVRYITNFSSGKLGTLIGEEFYRYGRDTHVIVGDCATTPKCYTNLLTVEKHNEFCQAVQNYSSLYPEDLVLCAAVLDYVPEGIKAGKIRSDLNLSVNFLTTDKLRSQLDSNINHKVCFKLEPKELSDDQMVEIFLRFKDQDQVTHLIFNSLESIKQDNYQATLVSEFKDLDQFDHSGYLDLVSDTGNSKDNTKHTKVYQVGDVRYRFVRKLSKKDLSQCLVALLS